RTGDVRGGELRTGDVRPPAGPAGRVGDGLRSGGTLRTPPPPPAAPPMPPAPPRPAPPPLPVPGPLPVPMGAAPHSVTTGMIRRAELRKHLKVQQQLKGITLVLVVMLLLAAYPIYLFAQTFAADPVFSELDGLKLPSWAAYEHTDKADGSRWCIGSCRDRVRELYSERGTDETQTAYAQALVSDGWRPRANC